MVLTSEETQLPKAGNSSAISLAYNLFLPPPSHQTGQLHPSCWPTAQADHFSPLYMILFSQFVVVVVVDKPVRPLTDEDGQVMLATFLGPKENYRWHLPEVGVEASLPAKWWTASFVVSMYAISILEKSDMTACFPQKWMIGLIWNYLFNNKFRGVIQGLWILKPDHYCGLLTLFAGETELLRDMQVNSKAGLVKCWSFSCPYIHTCPEMTSSSVKWGGGAIMLS